MKKFMKLALLTFLLWMPIHISAKDQISQYYIAMTVQENGDVTVEELFILDGTFNGYNRIINYKNDNAKAFDGSLDSFNGSDIYNGDSIIVEEIRSLDVSSQSSFDDIWSEGTVFKQTYSASKGDFGVYTITQTSNGRKITIYNPSSKGERGFYIKYTIPNMAVVHNDVAEIGFNLFTEEQTEYIANLEMHIFLPDNVEELRAWGHGPLWGETENVSKEEIKLTIQNLESQTPTDIRFVFDKTVVPYSTKWTKVDALDSILAVESEKAEEANLLREEAKESQKRKEILLKIFFVASIGWLIGLVFIIIHVYRKHDKEYENTLPSKYYRDFPDTYGPEIVGYLFHKQISNDDLSASILNLIHKKAIAYEKAEKKDDYKLINLNVESNTLTEAEQKLLKWLFHDVEEIKLSDLKKEAKTSYNDFIKRYTEWKRQATKDGESHQFFEKSTGTRVLSILYAFIGIYFVPSMLVMLGHPVLGVLSSLILISSIVYFAVYKKRTKDGNAAYRKWNGLKNFMLDFGKMDDKELPEIELWEKYLVYAVSLGCAKKLAKTMEVKVKEMDLANESVGNMTFDMSDMYLWTSLSRSINSSISSAISTATSQIASSSSSSSGGFGGGFSGGGGSFGGGGGGGRF